MAQKIKGVFPGSKRYTHEVVLKAGGRQYGLHLLNGIQSARVIPPRRQTPLVALQQNSFHGGRGAELWSPNTHQVYDTRNAWDATPNKLHPALLFRWYEGFRDAETNMPDSGDIHQWIPLYAGSGTDPNRRYQAVKFTASASSNRERAFIILRKRGTPPDDLTWEWNADSTGSPSASATKTGTIAETVLTDKFLSEYTELLPSSVMAVTLSTDYWIKLDGGANANQYNCWEVLCDSVASSGKNSSDNSTWSSTNYSPYYRITNEDVDRRLIPFYFDGAWYAVTYRPDGSNSGLFIHGNRGLATAGGASTLTDTGAGQYSGSWTTNMWANYKIRIVRGTGHGQVRTISSNTSTVLTVSSPWNTVPSTDSEYVIYGGKQWKQIIVTLGNTTGKPVVSNGIVYFPQNDSTDIRIMHLDYTAGDDHALDTEDTNHNQAYFIVSSYDASLGPVIVRANNDATGGGSPAGKACSIGKGPTSPSGTPVTFGTDITFQKSILIGDSTQLITGLFDHQNTLYVAKEDFLYKVSGDIPVKIAYGADASPNAHNGRSVCSGADGLFYITAENDIFVVSGGNSYPTNLPFNIPAARSGYVEDMISEKGWLFAALNAGASGNSSIMRMTLRERTWHEPVRAFATGRRIRNVAWLNHSDTRPHLAYECEGELLYQEMPLYGVRPSQDSGLLYQHEAEIILPTMDMLNTEPKFFSHFTLNSKYLADGTYAAAYARGIELDYQLNNNIGSTTWNHQGKFGVSPQDYVHINLGSQYKLRPRMRILNNDPSNPPIVENLSLTLFSRQKLTSGVQLDVNGILDDKVSGEEILSWIIDLVNTADVVEVESVFHHLHNKRVILPSEPNNNILSLDPKFGFSSVFQLYMEYAPEVNG